MLERQSPAFPWSSIAPTTNDQAAFATKWRNKAPSLPIALLDRSYLAPHLEQYAVALGHSPEAEAKAIAAGRFRLSSGEFINLGSAPEWNRERQAVVSQHWSKIPVKAGSVSVAANEVSEFNWVYTLVRAWILSGDDAHVESFWNLLGDWMEKNPPNLGPQWVSDEAIARRLIAVTYAVQALRFHPSTSDERLARAARLILISAKRLESTHNLAYGRSGIAGLTSSLALFTAGALWPQLAEADVWRSEGLESLINNGKKIFADDAKLAARATGDALRVLEIYTFAEIILRRENERESLPESLHKNIRVLISSLAKNQLSGPTGVPLFFLSGCPSSDARPTIATALILFTGINYSAGPWTEAVVLSAGFICNSSSSVE